MLTLYLRRSMYTRICGERGLLQVSAAGSAAKTCSTVIARTQGCRGSDASVKSSRLQGAQAQADVSTRWRAGSPHGPKAAASTGP